MTRDDILEAARANGYDLADKKDEQLLSDWSFFKAAFKDFEEELFSSLKMEGSAMAAFNTAARVRFNLALDWLDAGKTLDDIWGYVASGSQKKSDLHDASGNLIVSKL